MMFGMVFNRFVFLIVVLLFVERYVLRIVRHYEIRQEIYFIEFCRLGPNYLLDWFI